MDAEAARSFYVDEVWPRLGDEIVGNIRPCSSQNLLDRNLGQPLIIGIEAHDLTMKQTLANFRELCS